MMTRQEKVRVCEMRLNGMSIYQIADAVDKTPQNIFNFFSRMPVDKTRKYPRPKYSDDFILEICDERFKGITYPALAKIYNMSEDEVKDIFGYLASRLNGTKQGSIYYPNIHKWLVENAYSVDELSEACNVPKKKMIEALSGKFGDLMTYELADKISKFTGLTFSEIFAYQTRNESSVQKGDADVADEICE